VDEAEQLIPPYVSLRSELNDLEQANILQAENWAMRRRHDVLDEIFLRELHHRMFDRVWRWAGQYRLTERNLGVAPEQIREHIKLVIDDARYWLAQDTYPLDELAARFHHRLVWVHPFPNGNGRHGRLATDLLLVNNGQQRFSWGSHRAASPEATRGSYIEAMQAADRGHIEPLRAFVRT